MAKGSKKGACSSNTRAVKMNCLEHDRREYSDKNRPQYINWNLSHLNRTVFQSKALADRKHIGPLIEQARKEYTRLTGQKCQKSFSPFKESVLRINANVTDAQLLEFCRRAEELTGWKCMGIYVHLDEGHRHSKYIEGNTEFEINYHAHVIWDCQNHETGTINRIKNKSVLSKMQDELAGSTGMERGNKAEETGRQHRTAQQQRIKAQEDRIRQLEEKVRQSENMDPITAQKIIATGMVQESEQYKSLEQSFQTYKESWLKEYNAGKKKDTKIQELERDLNKANATIREKDEEHSELWEHYKTNWRPIDMAIQAIRRMARHIAESMDSIHIGNGITRLVEFSRNLIDYISAGRILIHAAGVDNQEQLDYVLPRVDKIAENEQTYALRTGRGL